MRKYQKIHCHIIKHIHSFFEIFKFRIGKYIIKLVTFGFRKAEELKMKWVATNHLKDCIQPINFGFVFTADL